MNKRITPNNIQSLNKNEVFVFGSNESGIHGAGAAKYACLYFGAKYGRGLGYGISEKGKSFAIPTKDWSIKTLDLFIIGFYISRFIEFAKINKQLTFYVTEIGCGLAGYKPVNIGPLFADAIELKNVYLPESFWEYAINEKNRREFNVY